MSFSSFEVLSPVIDEASKLFAPRFVPDEERVDILKEYCGVIDKLVEETKSTIFDVEVNEYDMTILISIGLDEYIDESPKNSMYGELFERAMSIQWEWTDEDKMMLKMKFPRVWVKHTDE